MNAIVSLLDETQAARAAALAAELAEPLGLADPAQMLFPHLSYLVAPDCDDDDLLPRLAAIAARQRPISVTTSGFGVFNRPLTVVYLTVCRGAALTALHQSVWDELADECDDSLTHYQPERWIPHVTLAHQIRDRQTLSAAAALLAEHDLRWTLPLDNLALIRLHDGVGELRARFPLSGLTR